MAALKGLYAITDERLTPKDTLLEQVKECLKGGARIVQLRDKSSPDEALLPLARKLKRLCEGFGAVFLINDRVDLARQADADGVHLGKDDTDMEKARQILGPSAIIGISCYNELERAVFFEKKGADYVAFGSFFPSPTKPDAVKAPIELIVKAKALLNIPVCAIGGITSENARELISQGVDMVAVISDLWKARDIRAKAQMFQRLFERL